MHPYNLSHCHRYMEGLLSRAFTLTLDYSVNDDLLADCLLHYGVLYRVPQAVKVGK